MSHHPPRIHAFTLGHDLTGLAALGLFEPHPGLPRPLPACEALAHHLLAEAWPGSLHLGNEESHALMQEAMDEVRAHDPLLWPVPARSLYHVFLTPSAWGCAAICRAVSRKAAERREARRTILYGAFEELPEERDLRSIAVSAVTAARQLHGAAAGARNLCDGEPDSSVDALLGLLALHGVNLTINPQAPAPTVPPMPSPVVDLASVRDAAGKAAGTLRLPRSWAPA